MTGFSVAATAYDRFVGRYGPELAGQLCDAAGIAAPMRALDVGCGPGALTAVLLERLGRGAVAAVDPSDPFVEACRERVPGADVRKASAEALPFADESFDAVLSQLVVNFMSDAAGGLAEMRRVASPGAVVASVVWDYAGEMTLLRRFWDAAAEVSPAAAERDEGRVMRHCTRESLAELVALRGVAGCEGGAADGVGGLRGLRRPVVAVHQRSGARGCVRDLARRGGARAPALGLPGTPGRRRRPLHADRPRVVRGR